MEDEAKKAPPSKSREAVAEYNRNYYAHRKKQIAARKKQRYDHDPEYKAQILATRVQQRESEKKARHREAAKRIPSRQKPGKRMKVTLGDGRQVVSVMLSIGKAAYIIGIATTTLRKWEGEGIIPDAKFRTQGGHRLYSTAQAEAMGEIYTRYSSTGRRWVITADFILEMHVAFNAWETEVVD